MVFGEEIAIIIERFDRASVAGEVRRIHQEDLCQALGVSPLRKYEADGGPGAEELFRVIEEHGSDAYQDLERATDALLFSWLTAGTDAHAKNYSLLLGPDGLARLSPLYDLATAAPYPLQIPPQGMKLAMRIGGEYQVERILSRHMDRLGALAGYASGSLPERARALGGEILEQIRRVRSDGLDDGLEERCVEAWAGSLERHVQHRMGGL